MTSPFGALACAFAGCLVLGAGTACNSTSAPIAGQIVVGDFGGASALLHADSLGATIDLGCALVRVSAPLMTDTNGDFALSGQRTRSGGPPPMPGEGSTPVRVDGQATSANGGTLRVVLSPIPDEPGAPAGESTTIVVVRNRQTQLLRCP